MPRAALLLLPLLLVGCQQAHPYHPRGLPKKADEKVEAKAPDPPIPAEWAWQDDTGRFGNPGEIPIVFVHEGSQPQAWKELKTFWTDTVEPAGKKDAPDKRVVRIKVPRGLADPKEHIPAANPPTRGKWELGRRLFFDAGWLRAKGDQSCASCHRPGKGFTDGRTRVADSYNTPTLLNVVYNRHQFWDGRARYLEEVVQRTLDDEREPKAAEPFQHVWHGVIGRLRANKEYRERFLEVFTVEPTQDTLGKALATYLRTLLSGNALHDRMTARLKKNAEPTAADYEALLDDATLRALGRPGAVKAVAAEDLLRGYRLFHGKAGCARCHPPSNGRYADGSFHNIGVGSEELGRFARAPLGERNRYLRGAFKTPTLRDLGRTAPYFHNGQEENLAEAVRLHVSKAPVGAPINLYLDPKLADADGGHRDFGLDDNDITAITTFLRALDGETVAWEGLAAEKLTKNSRKD